MPALNRPLMYASIAFFLMIHLVLLGHIEIAGAKPDIMLALVVFTGLFFGPGPGLEAGIVSGIGKEY